MKSCNSCIHAKEPLVPCDWLAEQAIVITDCPRYQKKTKAKMTKEQAIHILMHIETNVEHDEDFGIMVKAPLMDACVLAIKALKADAVEVVRCKDCTHYDNDKYICNFHSEEPQIYATFSVDMTPDDFCSYGERKDNEQT